MIELRGVSKSFGAQHVLEDIDLEIRAGDKLCIIGQSGCGKSVMMKIVVGLLRADGGQVLIDGEDMTGAAQKDWDGKLADFGVVFQGAALFDSLNVLENVGIRLFEERRLSRARVRGMCAEALEQVGLDPGEVLVKFPAELSGGMRKRVGIARAIVHRPRIVFYDEPTTGLDPVNSARIDELIDRLAAEEGRTSVIITHDMYTVRTIASRVAFIHDRRLRFTGSPAELAASEDPEVRAFLVRSG